jgi:hypothetical protein
VGEWLLRVRLASCFASESAEWTAPQPIEARSWSSSAASTSGSVAAIERTLTLA